MIYLKPRQLTALFLEAAYGAIFDHSTRGTAGM